MKVIGIPAAFVILFSILYHTIGEQGAVGVTLFVVLVIAGVRLFARKSEAREK